MTNWEEIGRKLLERQRRVEERQPELLGVILTWRLQKYIGSIVPPYLRENPEIVLLSKSTRPIPAQLVEAMKRLDPGRLEVEADEALDLQGPDHQLRRIGKRLTIMTPEQTRYALTHPIRPISY